MATGTAGGTFTNVYYKRTAGTPKQCFICYRPTTTVLSTINTVDFIYACPGHLLDPGFASALGSSGEGSVGANGAKKMGLSEEEIASIRKEWEEKQRVKKERKEQEEKDKKEKDADAEGKDPKETDGKDGKNTSSSSSPSVSLPGSLATSPPPATPSATHERYALHRDIFQMRLTEHRKRRQVTQAREVAPRLPGAPRGGLA